MQQMWNTPRLRWAATVTLCTAALIAVTASPSAQAQPACADLGGTVGADQVCTVHAAGAGYTIDISFPTDYPDQQAVGAHLTQERAGFLDWMAQVSPKMQTGLYALGITATAYRSTGTRSLVFQEEDNEGLAHEGHPDTSYRSFNYDTAKGAPITFDTLFKPGSQPLDVLNPVVATELNKRGGPDALPALQDAGATAYSNFAITDDAMVFFFGESQLMVSNSGPQQVSVPRAALASVLA
jgi:Protein of unknown function (DUF3298)